MKIGIVTINGDNYGNRLQNYALQELIESTGNEAVTLLMADSRKFKVPETFTDKLLKLRPNYMRAVFNSRFNTKYHRKNDRDGYIKAIKFAKSTDISGMRAKRTAAFRTFSDKYITSDKKVYKSGESIDSCDAYVCGSDQIWNPTYASCTGAYFLDFAPENRRIAFAPSFGLSQIPEMLKPAYRKFLNDIDHLSVRESKGADIIRELTGREVPVIADPTLCITADEWKKIAKKPSFDVGDDFIVTYFLGNETDKYRKHIEKYAGENRLKIIDLYDLRSPEYYSADPSHFVWLISHAKAVFTDSFHGTVFSLIFHKPFVVFDRMESGGTGMNSRFDTLLGATNMQSRKYKNFPEIDNINFEYSDRAIEKMRDTALKFLRDSLDSVLQNGKTESVSLNSVLKSETRCTGCGACAEKCPIGAIKMTADGEGFKYPRIDTEKCADCGLCRSTCPVNLDLHNGFSPTAFVAYSNDADVRKSSSSGGIFTEFASAVIDRGGIVYGAGFDADGRVRHLAVENISDLAKLRGSKYVQSDLGGTFSDVKRQLDSGRTVYFSGTPCQVEGLLSFVGNGCQNLYTQDIVCHGVPSPAVWAEYLNKKPHSAADNISFRDKKYGWHYFSLKIGKYLKRFDEDTYTRLFLSNVILRPSCYDCAFKKETRNSDFTLADCWNSERAGTSLKDDDKGMSMVFLNSEKAVALFNGIRKNLTAEEIPYDTAINLQAAATQSVSRNIERDAFFSVAKENDIRHALDLWEKGAASGIKKSLQYYKYKLARSIKCLLSKIR